MQKIAILDAGSQFGKLIDRRIRELNVCCEFKPINTVFDELHEYSGIIISGGPQSVTDNNSVCCDLEILLNNDKIPVLGICYGMQLINYITGGTIEKKTTREDGQDIVQLDLKSKIFTGLNELETVLLTHGDSVDKLGDNFRAIGTSSHGIITAIEHKYNKIYGVQFHPEVDLTLNGTKIFENFLFEICKITPSFNLDNRTEDLIKEIVGIVGDKKVLVLISGGVDSTVCCALLIKALGKEKVICLHIDTGFMRKNESFLVKKSLESIGIDMIVIDAEKEFLNAMTFINNIESEKLCQTTNPETKRKIIGDTFMKITDTEVIRLQKIGLLGNTDDFLLAQGTLRPDLIESANTIASCNADIIKTHHNDTHLVRQKREQGLIIEPLKDYHKDEVRKIGLKLGLSEKFVYRQPFPGPGLAIRILCNNDTKTIINQLPKHIVDQVLLDNTDYELVVLPIKSVGIQGDARTYSNVVAIYSRDPTIKPDWKYLASVAKSIPKIAHNINRVVYIFGSFDKPNIISTLLEHTIIDLLREVEFDICEHLNSNIDIKFSQVPVVLLPLYFGDSDINKRSIVIRPFMTNDFMTGLAAIPDVDYPANNLYEIVEHITKYYPISRLMYDLTNKPPATTEWE